jgi:hypothetical protein
MTNDVREIIQCWLLAADYSISEVQAPDAQWVLRATPQSGPFLLVGLNKRPEDQIRIHSGLTIAENHKPALANLPPDARSAFLWELRFALLKMNLVFTGIEDAPEQIAVYKHLYLEGLSKTPFMDAFELVRNGFFLVAWSFHRQFDSSPGPAETAPGIN